jgi:hypothetical protein
MPAPVWRSPPYCPIKAVSHGGNTTGVGAVYYLLFSQGALLAPKFTFIECNGRQGY